MFHDADHIAVGAGLPSEVRAALLPSSGRPYCVGPTTPPGLRHLERRRHVRERSENMWGLHVLRAYGRADASQLLYN